MFKTVMNILVNGFFGLKKDNKKKPVDNSPNCVSGMPNFYYGSCASPSYHGDVSIHNTHFEEGVSE